MDIIERGSDKVLDPPKDLHMLNGLGESVCLLHALGGAVPRADNPEIVKDGKVLSIPGPRPLEEERDKRYRASAGSALIILQHFQVVGHIDIPRVVAS